MAFQLGPHSWWVVCQSLKLEREQRWRQPVLSAQPLSTPRETTASMKPKVDLSHQEVQDNSNFFHGKQMPGTVPSTPSNGIPTSTCRGGGHYPLYRYMKGHLSKVTKLTSHYTKQVHLFRKLHCHPQYFQKPSRVEAHVLILSSVYLFPFLIFN